MKTSQESVGMTHPDPVVFLLDVDNTLLDNDWIIGDLKRHLTQAFGLTTKTCTPEGAKREGQRPHRSTYVCSTRSTDSVW